MTREPFLLVQLSDPHIGATWADRDPAAALAAAVEQVAALDPAPAAVLVTVTSPSTPRTPNTTSRASCSLRSAPRSTCCRATTTTATRCAATSACRREQERPCRTRPTSGRCGCSRSTARGRARTAASSTRSGWVPALDAIGLPAGDRRALGAVVERPPQVLRIVGGHVHRPVMAQLGGRAVLAAPSTYLQLRLDFRSEAIVPADEPGGFALHAFSGGELVSHVVPVTADRTR